MEIRYIEDNQAVTIVNGQYSIIDIVSNKLNNSTNPANSLTSIHNNNNGINNNKVSKRNTNKRISSLIKLSLILISLIILIQLPILHQTLSNGTTHFSILTSLQMDISEHDNCTIYFIMNMFGK